jgi:hypothetical protein
MCVKGDDTSMGVSSFATCNVRMLCVASVDPFTYSTRRQKQVLIAFNKLLR